MRLGSMARQATRVGLHLIMNFQQARQKATNTCNAARKHGTASNTGWSAFDNEFSASPPESYLKSIPPDTLRSMKQVLGSDYIFELTIGGISVYSMISPSYFLRVFIYGRLIRLSDGAVLWLDKIVGATKIDNLKDYKELETNNLALLKERYEKAIVNVFEPNRKFQTGMGFAYNTSSFFKGLFPQ